MPYYAGDAQRYRIRMSGRMYRYGYGDGLFSRFSFKKLGRFIGKVGKPLLSVAGSVAGALVPGVGGLISKGTELIAKARGSAGPVIEALRASPIIREAAGAQVAMADPTGIAGVLSGADPGTPGIIAAQAGGRVRGRRARRVTRRRRRRY